MTVQRKILVAMEAVFPAGAFLVGPVEPVWNFDKAVQRPDGSRPVCRSGRRRCWTWTRTPATGTRRWW